MHRVLNLLDLAWIGALGFGVYKIVELGPHDAVALMGRCVRVFVLALQGYT